MKSEFCKRRLSLLLKTIVFLSAVTGTILSASGGNRGFMGGIYVFRYFTIQSNLLMALICLAGLVSLLKKQKTTRFARIVKLVGTVSITLTGMVFCFVLAPTLGKNAWGIHNVLTHVVVPVASVLDFFVAGSRYRCRKKDIPFVILPPLLYAIYAGIGYAAGLEFSPGVCYPYFFLNWGSPAGALGFTEGLPYMGCVWWILVLLVFLLLVGNLYLTIQNRLIRNETESQAME